MKNKSSFLTVLLLSMFFMFSPMGVSAQVQQPPAGSSGGSGGGGGTVTGADGTEVTVKHASTPAASTDTSLVVALNPNTPVPLPTGAATDTNQSTEITRLTTISGFLSLTHKSTGGLFDIFGTNDGFGAFGVRNDTPIATGAVNGTFAYYSVDANGRLWTSTKLDTALPTGANNIGSITNVTGTVSLPTGAATESTLLNLYNELQAPIDTIGTHSIQDANNANPLTILTAAPVAGDAGVIVRNIPSGTQSVAQSATVPAQVTGSLLTIGDTVAATVTGMGSVAVKYSIASNCSGSGCVFVYEASLNNTDFSPVEAWIWQGTATSGNTQLSPFTTLTTTAATQTPGLGLISLPAGVTNFRVRRIDGNTGTVAIIVAPSASPYSYPMTTLPNNVSQSTNIAQIGGSAIPIANGATTFNTPRFTLSNDSTGHLELWDGTNTATIKAASTAAVASDPAVVVAISPNNAVAVTANAGTNLNTSALALDATLTGRTAKLQITDGTRDGTVKAASTLPALTDTAVVTTQRDPLPAGTNVLGHVIVDSGSITAATTLAAETTKVIGTVNVASAQTIAVTQATPASLNATVTPIALTKSTQGSTGFSVQSLIDAGRTAKSFYANNVASGTTTTETLITFTQSSGTSATSNVTSYTITNGKNFRITALSVASRGNATATIQSTVFNLRMNTGGACVVTSTPILFAAQSATAAVASAWDRVIIPIPEGYEIAGNGTISICISAAATFTTNAPTWSVNLIGYEY